MKVTDWLTTDCIKLSLSSSDKQSALRELAHLVADSNGDEAERLTAYLIDRENVRTTGYGKKVALPRSCKAKGHGMALGRCAPMDWDSVDKKPVVLVFLLTSSARQWGEHLLLLSSVAKVLSDEILKKRIMDATTAEQIIAIFAEHARVQKQD